MKKIILTFVTALSILFSMSACAKDYGSTDQERTEQSQAALINESDLTDQSATDETQLSEADLANQLIANYLDIDSLPILDISIEDKYTFDDRTITLEDSIDNEIELLAYHYYYYSSSGEYEKLANLFGDNKSLQLAISNEEAKFKEGLYMSEYNIHKLTTLTANDLEKINAPYKKEILNDIGSYGFDKYAVVCVEVSWKHNESSLRKGPQLGDGNYTRYYLAANTEDNPNFSIYEFYWEDFLQ